MYLYPVIGLFSSYSSFGCPRIFVRVVKQLFISIFRFTVNCCYRLFAVFTCFSQLSHVAYVYFLCCCLLIFLYGQVFLF